MNQICPLCNDEVALDDDAVPINGIDRGCHRECLIRSVAGSVGHQRKECGCYGKVDSSEEGLTRREAARRAYEEFKKVQA